MATVTNPASLNSVKSVFGGPNNLRAYLRGGTYVLGIANAYPNIAASGTLLLSGFAGTVKPVTYLPANTDSTNSPPPGVSAYAEIEIGGASNTTVKYNSTATWRLAGNPGDYEVYFQKNSGTTPAGSAVNTWLNLATTRTWSLSQAPTNNNKTTYGQLLIRMSASPFTTLNTAGVWMYVFAESNQCPTCCFTPDTLISMADGTTRAIVAVMVGDWIMVRGGTKQVTEVITRTNRVMYQIQFADGRILNASEDHPLYVVDKGYAAINPGVGGMYKDLGIPDQLYVGDLVLDSEGKENQIVSITELDYPETVYTFAESEFYANGMLVY
jgi:hypothetical protein